MVDGARGESNQGGGGRLVPWHAGGVVPLEVESRAQLERMLAQGAEIRAEWSVRCEIGPDWIGAGRFFSFWVGEEPLDEHCMGHRLLAQAIIDHFALPESHEDEATHGDGTIERRGDALWIDYEWSRGVPYQYPSASGIDEAVIELPPEPA